MSSQLTVIIIGAGISGLTAAIALRRAGHLVKIFERSAQSRELGQGIVIASNAGRILESLGFDFGRAKNAPMAGRRVVNGETLEGLVPDLTYDDIPSLRSAPIRTAYRPDLHSELVRVATDHAGKGEPVRIQGSSTVVAVDARGGIVRLVDGSLARADLVVAADGIHSQAAGVLLTPEPPPKLEGSNVRVYRFTLSAEQLRRDPELESLLTIDDMRAHLAVSASKSSWLIWYWCRNEKDICSFGYYTTEDFDEDSNEEVHPLRSQVDRETLQQRLVKFHPAIGKAAGLAREILPVWRCASRTPITTFHRNRLLAIGDAAHPILPHIGLGAVSAIEDAGCLGALFTNFPADEDAVSDNIAARLEIYSNLRVPRLAAYKIYSDIPMFDDSAVEVQKEKVLQWLRPEELPANQSDLIPWYTRYDVVDVAARQLQQQTIS